MASHPIFEERTVFLFWWGTGGFAVILYEILNRKCSQLRWLYQNHICLMERFSGCTFSVKHRWT